MGKDLVVKDNVLINASYNLELTEQRLILLAIIEAREASKGITADSKLRIHASSYSERFNVSLDASYKALREAVNNLFERQFSFREEHEDTGKWGVVRSRWVSRVKYIDALAILEITFALDVIPFITRLEQRFTSYQIDQIAQLTSKHAVRIYELLISWRSVGKCYFEVDDFRKKIGIGVNEYTTMSNFKVRVLEPSLRQINELTDITVKYQQRKAGKSIIGFDFKFKIKDAPKQEKKVGNKDDSTIDMFSSMSDKQVSFFAHKLAHDDVFGSRVGIVGESRDDLKNRLFKQLKEPKNIDLWLDDLKRMGFGG